jgi:hypothetical protein
MEVGRFLEWSFNAYGKVVYKSRLRQFEEISPDHQREFDENPRSE